MTISFGTSDLISARKSKMCNLDYYRNRSVHRPLKVECNEILRRGARDEFRDALVKDNRTISTAKKWLGVAAVLCCSLRLYHVSVVCAPVLEHNVLQLATNVRGECRQKQRTRRHHFSTPLPEFRLQQNMSLTDAAVRVILELLDSRKGTTKELYLNRLS